MKTPTLNKGRYIKTNNAGMDCYAADNYSNSEVQAYVNYAEGIINSKYIVIETIDSGPGSHPRFTSRPQTFADGTVKRFSDKKIAAQSAMDARQQHDVIHVCVTDLMFA